MNQISSILRNIGTLVIFVALAAAVFWLISQQARHEVPQPVAQPPGQAPATPQATTEPAAALTPSLAPEPTHTPFTPEAVVGKGSFVTLPPPEPTLTPLGVGPDVGVQAVNDTPLLSADILLLMQIKENDTIWVEAWPAPDEIILRVGGYHPHSIFWAISPQQVQAQQLPNFQANPDSTAAAAELRHFDERVDYASVSPDGQWGAWGYEETLLIKQLGTDEPPANLLGVIEYERFQGGRDTLVWSPQSDQLAYAVDNDPQNRYEIRFSDPTNQQIKVVALRDTRPYHLAWSPDGQYLAFEMLEEPQSGITHIYVVKQDGTSLTQLTHHGIASGPIHWSPAGETIVYTYDVGDGRRPWLVTIAAR
jgi:hypothetical protein